jgi:hypothetical protein
VHFGFAGDDVDRSPRWVVRYSADGLVLGRRDAVDSALDVVQERAMPPRSRDGEGPGYHHLVVEFHGDYWFVYLDDELSPFGSAAVDSQAQNRTIQLVAIGSEVHFSDITSFMMQERPTQTKP